MPYANLTGDPAMCSDISNRPDADIVHKINEATRQASFKETLDKVTVNLDTSCAILNKIIDFLWGGAKLPGDDMNIAAFTCMNDNLDHINMVSEEIRDKLNVMADRLGMN